MTVVPFHAVIIGGGIGGLCLAQGLKRAGVSVALYERDRTPTDRLQGYRLTIDPQGSRALHECLPPRLYEDFVATCGGADKGFSLLNEQMEELFFTDLADDADVEPDPVNSYKSVSRVALRQVLLDGLDDVVHFDKKFVRYEASPGGKASAFFEDGTSATGDVLVAADGANSTVRKQFLPHADRVDTGVLTVAAKVLLTSETSKLLPPRLFDGPALVLAPEGRGMFIAVQRFRHEPDDVADTTVGNGGSAGSHPGHLFDNTEDYVLWAFGARREQYGFEGEPDRLDGVAVQGAVLRMTEDWHPRLRNLVRAADTSTVGCVPIHSSVPIDHWETENVTLIGDAIHSMTPYRGIGANTALRDAQLLCQSLISARRGERLLLGAVRDYEVGMLAYGFEAVRNSMRALEQWAFPENTVSP